MTNPEPIDPSQLTPGPICNESLSPEILDLAKAVYEVIGPYVSTSLERFEINLMRDRDPAAEVAVWCSITAAWIDYHEQYLDGELLPEDEEKKLLAALITISTGNVDVGSFGVAPDVGQKLLECYDSLGAE